MHCLENAKHDVYGWFHNTFRNDIAVQNSHHEYQLNDNENPLHACILCYLIPLFSSPPSVSWTYQTVSGTTTNIQSNAYLGSSHVDIVVTTVNAGNQGIYTCTSQTGISYSSTLIVRSKPVHIRKSVCIIHIFFVRVHCTGRPVIDASNSLALTPVSFLYGVAFTLSCNASGNELTWLWYHNGMRLSGTSGRLLVVPSPTLDDSGIYQCFAYNPFSNVSATGNISVQSELDIPFLLFLMAT